MTTPDAWPTFIAEEEFLPK